jgi:cobalt-zinc-cadmium efflux system outer membrane protein
VTQIERTSGLVDEVRQSVASRVVAGVVSPIEETRATVAAAAIRVDLARARRTLEASRSRLALFWGSPTAAFTAAEGTLQIVPPPAPPLTVLVGKLEQNPEIARWAAEIAQRRASVAVERGKRIPDLSLSAGYRRFTALSTSALVVGATISLPLFDGNGSGIREARIRAARADEERRATESRALAALADGYAALTSAIDEVNTLSQSVLPGSQQTFEAISEGYRLGRFSYLDVLDAQRTLIGARSQYLRALADYRKGVANVERLIGAPLHDAAIGTTATK